MTNLLKSQTQGETAISVVSPMSRGGETKNQDRACWFPALQIASLADGVSSSPYGAEGAQMAVEYSPVLFSRDVDMTQRLFSLADLLSSKRIEAEARGLKADPSTPLAIRAMLEEAARENMTCSYQTTLVSAAFVQGVHSIHATVLSVGDSGFFAFANDGELLWSNLSESTESGAISNSQSFTMGPGASFLCRVIGDASQQPDLARQVGIRTGSLGSWLTVMPIEQLNEPDIHQSTLCINVPVGEMFFVPRYLYETIDGLNGMGYGRVRYSQSLRIPSVNIHQDLAFKDKGSATAVLPDHVYTGNYTFITEQFSPNGYFLLCSDGFYSAFDNPNQMWTWLIDNSHDLNNPTQRENLLFQLHQQLHNQTCDDDISFIWLPASALTQSHELEVQNAK